MKAVGSHIQLSRYGYTMNLSYCILAEAVIKEMEAVGSHIQVWLHSYFILAEAVKKEMEAVGSHIQVSCRRTFPTASWQRLSRRRWRV
jgi:hypothetical protein